MVILQPVKSYLATISVFHRKKSAGRPPECVCSAVQASVLIVALGRTRDSAPEEPCRSFVVCPPAVKERGSDRVEDRRGCRARARERLALCEFLS